MTTYIVRRLVQAFVVLILSTLILFLVARLMPGDPILLYLSQDQFTRITKEEIDALRHQWGLDRPLIVQYFAWIWGVLHGDFGKSIFWGTTVLHEIKRALPITLTVGLFAWIFSHILSTLIGVITAIRRGTWWDTVFTTMANLGLTIPEFWLGILFIYFFGLYLGWFPIQGYVAPWKDFVDSMRHLFMPVFVLSVFTIGGGVRQTRSAMLEVIRQDYIRTAWSKGLSEGQVIFRHALKPGLIPVVTLAGMSIPRIFGGQVMIETVFNIPGMGRLATDAVFAKDYAVMQGLTLMMASIVILTNLLVDISYGWLDPRVRYG